MTSSWALAHLAYSSIGLFEALYLFHYNIITISFSIMETKNGIERLWKRKKTLRQIGRVRTFVSFRLAKLIHIQTYRTTCARLTTRAGTSYESTNCIEYLSEIYVYKTITWFGLNGGPMTLRFVNVRFFRKTTRRKTLWMTPIDWFAFNHRLLQ